MTLASSIPADPLVSVVVPVYNGAAYLDATLAAARAQTYRQIEIIIVDDGSTDRSRAIVEAHGADDSRVRLVAQANSGVATARNRGIEDARGTLIAPLDADDLWDPSKVARQVARFAEAGDAAGLVYSWWIWIDGDGMVIDTSPRWRVEGAAADALLQVNYIGCASIPMFRRADVVALGGYDASMPTGCEDWDLALRVAERSHVAVVPAALVAYRRHRHSMSRGTGGMRRSFDAVVARLRRRRPDVDAAIVRRAEDQFALHLAGVSFWSRDYRRAVEWGVRAMRSTLPFAVLPHVARLFAGRMAGGASSRRVIRPGVPFADSIADPPLIPYDRIYQRRFARLTRPL